MNVKICGLCRPEDAALAAAAGADYLGVILARKGPRQQSRQAAAAIYQAAPDLLHVGVFADQPLQEIVPLAQLLHLDVIQLHGSETPQFINELESETDAAVWKSFHVRSRAELASAIDTFSDHVDALLLDSSQGGSGQRFDWNVAIDARALLPPNVKLVVAGGLTPGNVGAVIATLRPDIVDVASGVESTVGVKSKESMTEFVRNARA